MSSLKILTEKRPAFNNKAVVYFNVTRLRNSCHGIFVCVCMCVCVCVCVCFFFWGGGGTGVMLFHVSFFKGTKQLESSWEHEAFQFYV